MTANENVQPKRDRSLKGVSRQNVLIQQYVVSRHIHELNKEETRQSLCTSTLWIGRINKWVVSEPNIIKVLQ